MDERTILVEQNMAEHSGRLAVAVVVTFADCRDQTST